MNYLLAVDGGGTKTEFCISDEKGNLIGSVMTGAGSFKSVGEQESLKQLKKGMELLREKYQVTLENISFSVFGMSGCDSMKDYNIINQQIQKLGFKDNQFYLCNDGVLAFFAQASAPGIVVIAGTGSIVIGIDENGKIKRSGGWGYNISDIGSGYWMGCQVLEKTLLYCDGCYEYDDVFGQIRKHFHSDNFEELPFKITAIRDRSQITSLSRCVIEQAASGQGVSFEILKRGAEHLATLVYSVYRKMNGPKVLRLVFSGGVMANEIYQQLLKEAVKVLVKDSEIRFYMQKNRPSYGGIRLALDFIGRNPRSEKRSWINGAKKNCAANFLGGVFTERD